MSENIMGEIAAATILARRGIPYYVVLYIMEMVTYKRRTQLNKYETFTKHYLNHTKSGRPALFCAICLKTNIKRDKERCSSCKAYCCRKCVDIRCKGHAAVYLICEWVSCVRCNKECPTCKKCPACGEMAKIKTCKICKEDRCVLCINMFECPHCRQVGCDLGQKIGSGNQLCVECNEKWNLV